MFCVSLLYSTQDFLKLIPEVGMTPTDFKSHFQTFKYSTADKILQVSFKCGWTKLIENGSIVLTERGKQISDLDYKPALLYQLEDLILNFNPVWGAVLLKGRVEAKHFLPPDVAQCFRESGLFDDLADDLINYWDKLSLAYRNYSQRKMVEIGRAGEKLSFNHEWQRTGQRPIWQAIESSVAGYDILSFTSSSHTARLRIEVKATTSEIAYAKVHVTRNEWNTAANSDSYVFHLWHIDQHPTLFEVSVDQMEKHIPTDNGHGSWETVEISFKALIKKD